MWLSIRIWCFELFLSYLWMMSRKNNLIQIQTTTTNNYSLVGNWYTLDQLWQIKERVEQDRTLSIISPEIVNWFRKLRIQKRRNGGKRGGLKMHYPIPAKKRSININNIIQCIPKCLTSCDKELRKNLGLSLINIQSIKNKHTNLLDNLVENKTDICIVTETWLTEDDKIWLDCCDLSQNGYQIHSTNRKIEGRSLAIISTINTKIKLLDKGEKTSFEYAVWKVNTNNIVIAGDFNLYIDNNEDPEPQLFTDMMAALGLDCHVDFLPMRMVTV